VEDFDVIVRAGKEFVRLKSDLKVKEGRGYLKEVDVRSGFKL